MPKGRASNQAVKLMIIRDYLYSHSNENHFVTSKEIIAHLTSKGIRADRKTIFSDIRRLEDDYGMKIVHNTRKGYRIESPIFEPRELRLMIDSVQSAHFITENEAANITRKIKELADVYTQPTLDRKAYVNDRIRNSKESVVARTDIIHEAISLDAQVAFKYFHYYPSLKKETKKYSKQGNPYVVSPFALYWNNGNYYLYAYVSDRSRFQFFRIDRMESIQITSNSREGHDSFSAAMLQSNRKVKVFDMYATGNVVNVTLSGINKVADQVIDAFGNNLMFMPNKKEGYFTVNVLVDVSPPFFAWLTNFGNQIEIANPPQVREQFKNHIKGIADMYE